MRYDDDWIPPWRVGLPQARCQGPNCTPEGVPGRLVVASTLNERGWCVNCARDVDDTDRRLR